MYAVDPANGERILLADGSKCPRMNVGARVFPESPRNTDSRIVWKDVVDGMRQGGDAMSKAVASKKALENWQRAYIKSLGGESNHEPNFFRKNGSEWILA